MTSNSQEPDYYAILHLERGCTQEQVREQFKRMVKIFHPDRHQGDPWCAEQLRLCNLAYAVLGDAVSRRAYDLRIGGASAAAIFDFSRDDDTAEQEPAAVRSPERWSFQVPPDPTPAPAAGPLFADIPVSTRTAPAVNFGDGMRGPAWPANRAVEVNPAATLRTNRIFVGAMIVAAVAAAVLVMLTGNTSVLPLPSEPSPMQMNQFYAAGSSDTISSSTIAVTPNLQATAQSTHAADAQTKTMIAPDWLRYQRDQKYAQHLAHVAASHVGQGEKSELAADIATMQQTTTEIQDQFDDLSYGADSGDIADAMSRLSEQIGSLELQIDDIQALCFPAPKTFHRRQQVAI